MFILEKNFQVQVRRDKIDAANCEIRLSYTSPPPALSLYQRKVETHNPRRDRGPRTIYMYYGNNRAKHFFTPLLIFDFREKKVAVLHVVVVDHDNTVTVNNEERDKLKFISTTGPKAIFISFFLSSSESECASTDRLYTHTSMYTICAYIHVLALLAGLFQNISPTFSRNHHGGVSGRWVGRYMYMYTDTKAIQIQIQYMRNKQTKRGDIMSTSSDPASMLTSI